MENTIIQDLKDALAKSQSIGIAVGRGPSMDQMAAALSLYLLLKNANKKVSVASPDNPIVEISSLVGINKVQKTLGGGGEGGDFVVSFPYREEGEIEKVSYTLENNYLNIIVKAGEKGLSFDERDVKYSSGGGGGEIDLLIAIGTAQLSELRDVYDPAKLEKLRIINIDNQEENQRFGDIVLVSPKFSSVSEQVAELALTLGFQIDRDVAQNLLSGILVTTKNFQDPATTPLAFEMASEMMKRGAQRLRQAPERREERREERPRASAPRDDRRDEPARQSASAYDDDRQEDTRRPAPAPRQSDDRDRDRQREDSYGSSARDQRNSRNQNDDTDEAPGDWLAPKVYKGSTKVE